MSITKITVTFVVVYFLSLFWLHFVCIIKTKFNVRYQLHCPAIKLYSFIQFSILFIFNAL